MRVMSIVKANLNIHGALDADNEFINRIVPSANLPSSMMTRESWTEINVVRPLDVKYRIDLEYRSWGIKGASITLDHSAPIRVELELKTETGTDDNPVVAEDTRVITVDPSKIRVELSPGSMIYLHSMELFLKPDMTVDYDNSVIQGTTLMGMS